MVGRSPTVIYNVPTHILPGVRMQIKFTRQNVRYTCIVRTLILLLILLDAQLLVKRFRLNLAYLIAHNTALQAGAIERYNMTTVEIKTFTYAKGLQLLSIDNAILGPIQKRLLFVMVDNGEFLVSLTAISFNFQHFDMTFYSVRQRQTAS